MYPVKRMRFHSHIRINLPKRIYESSGRFGDWKKVKMRFHNHSRITNSTADRHIKYTHNHFSVCEQILRMSKKKNVSLTHESVCLSSSSCKQNLALRAERSWAYCSVYKRLSIESIVNIHLFGAILGLVFLIFACLVHSHSRTHQHQQALNK